VQVVDLGSSPRRPPRDSAYRGKRTVAPFDVPLSEPMADG